MRTKYWSENLKGKDLFENLSVYRLDNRGIGVQFPARIKVSPSTTASRLLMRPAHPIQWVPGTVSVGLRGKDIKLIPHLHLVPRLLIRGAIPSLPHTSS
jgi:hypothetical protein